MTCQVIWFHGKRLGSHRWLSQRPRLFLKTDCCIPSYYYMNVWYMARLIITYHLCNMRSFCPKCCRRCKRIWGEILMVIETAALIPKVCIDLVGNSSGYESVKAENTAWSGRWNQKMNFVLRLARSSYFVLVAWTLYDFGSESGESSLNIGSFAIMEIFECMWLQPSIFCILEKIEKRGTT